MSLAAKSTSLWWVAALALMACTQESAVEDTPPMDPVVVYAAYADKTYLPTLFTQFTAETGQIVLVRNGQVPAIVDDVIDNRVSPPADILFTPTVLGVWRAAEEGELRPHYSKTVDAIVPAWLRDPDKFWVAASYRSAVMVFSADEFSAADLPAYEDLAAAKFRRKLCLSTSSLAINRSVIAMLIRKLGAREAELAVRGWVANLAMPAFDNEDDLLRALRSGECAIGVLASDKVVLDEKSELKVHTPSETYVVAEAIGITRHARNPDGAAALINWLLREDVQRQHAEQMAAMPVVPDAHGNSATVHTAILQEDAAKLVERARYR